MRRKHLGTAAAGALATYVSFGVTALAASFAGLPPELSGVFYVGLLGALFFLLKKLWPLTFADGPRGPRPARRKAVGLLLSVASLLTGRVVVFLLILATMMLGFIEMHDRPWAASAAGLIWAALPVVGMLLLNSLENRRRGAARPGHLLGLTKRVS